LNHELIERFFRKECTAEEAYEVAAYLKTHPSVLEEYLSMHEFTSVAADDSMPEAFWNEIWLSIEKKKKTAIVTLERIAVAACVILFTCATLLYFNHSTKNAAKLPVVAAKHLPPTEYKTIINNTRKLMTVVLQDSSVVELSPASSIQYNVAFTNNRDIVLEGQAKFRVAKNKKKPFTVYAGALATTALGTVFSIKKGSNKNAITVKLYVGKVVIHSINNNLKGWKEDVYLLPGEQMKFDAPANVFFVKSIKDAKPLVAIKPKPYKDSLSAQLTFNNTVLTKVMHQLSAYYKVKIEYDSLLTDTINFTGAISKKDSLSFILRAIGQMNDLEISGDNNGFIVSKHKY
jgi:transmembrane sensor